MAKLETPLEKRCENCLELKFENGSWVCEECFKQKVNEIDECPLGVTLELLEELDRKGKEAYKHVAKAETKKERKPRERKADPTKEGIIKEIADFLTEIAENVEITNVSKIIEFDLSNEHYKIDLIRQRKPKK